MTIQGNPVANGMNGAHSLVHTLVAGGVDTCFSNPGTSEMHFVAALDQVPGIHCVLGLQENVVTGMADGFYRMAGRPAASLLHCGPGLANGLGNLHNARRGRAGIVNIVGDQATWHRPFDAPLTADTEGLARTVSDWVRTSTRAEDVGRDAASAIQHARRTGGGIATLVLPSDASWNEGGVCAEALPDLVPSAPDEHTVSTAARILREHGPSTLILLGTSATLAAPQREAFRIAQATGADLLVENACSRVARGQGNVPLGRVPYTGAEARAALQRYSHIILVASKAPISFFGYPNQPSIFHDPQAQIHPLSRHDQDPAEALRRLAEAVNAPAFHAPDPGPRPEAATGRPTPQGFARTLAALMPEGAVVSEESITFGRNFYPETFCAPQHDWLHLTGGAIGDGMPMATGAALGTGRGRRVINLQADGSAMYSLQSLWTQARERLPVTTVIFSNRKYNILINEYKNVGATPGETAMTMLDLGNPDLDWVSLGRGMGVDGARADTLEACADLMRQSFASDAPFLIELVI